MLSATSLNARTGEANKLVEKLFQDFHIRNEECIEMNVGYDGGVDVM